MLSRGQFVVILKTMKTHCKNTTPHANDKNLELVRLRLTNILNGLLSLNCKPSCVIITIRPINNKISGKNKNSVKNPLALSKKSQYTAKLLFECNDNEFIILKFRL
jgi:hypothetical protein